MVETIVEIFNGPTTIDQIPKYPTWGHYCTFGREHWITQFTTKKVVVRLGDPDTEFESNSGSPFYIDLFRMEVSEFGHPFWTEDNPIASESASTACEANQKAAKLRNEVEENLLLSCL